MPDLSPIRTAAPDTLGGQAGLQLRRACAGRRSLSERTIRPGALASGQAGEGARNIEIRTIRISKTRIAIPVWPREQNADTPYFGKCKFKYQNPTKRKIRTTRMTNNETADTPYCIKQLPVSILAPDNELKYIDINGRACRGALGLVAQAEPRTESREPSQAHGGMRNVWCPRAIRDDADRRDLSAAVARSRTQSMRQLHSSQLPLAEAWRGGLPALPTSPDRMISPCG